MRFPTVVGERDVIVRAGRTAVLATVVGALVGLLVAGAWYASRPVQYSSTIALELTSVSPVVDLNPTPQKLPQVTVDTDAVVAVADPVVAAVAAAVGGDLEDTRGGLSVRARTLSRVLELTYVTETSPEAAREGVTVAAEAYLDLREQLVIAPTRDYLGAVIGATAETQQQLVGKFPNLTRGQTSMEARLERAQAFQAQVPRPGLVLQSATLPAARRGTVDVMLVSGVFLGALVGFGAGLVLERRRRHRAAARHERLRADALDVVPHRELVDA